ncbi:MULTISPECIES: amidohydrolase family protein [Arthrobacter]|uniref:Amidohydrolase family protein n=2 Tax=Arthrobacter TaxID=1663 RepID=A0ABU9KGD4_9MICC|nr:amidohydrolase family protein [Arthrobacter sp. YJM1]MDP5225956.1 amidohydrolase family protein [Arthrobacter sp. YJM1]
MTQGQNGTNRLRLYVNGSIYSAADPFATAMLVDGGTVAWIGSEEAAKSLHDERMELVDLRGALVTPGFVDSHVHLTETGQGLTSLDLGGVRHRNELLDLVAGLGATLPAGETLFGHSWDETSWSDPTLPTLAELDNAGGGRVLYLARVDVHSALVSSASLERAGSLEGLRGAGEGAVVRLEAHAALRRRLRDFTPAQRRTFQQAALDEAARHGHVALAEMSGPSIAGVQDLRAAVAWNDDAAASPLILPYWGEAVGSAEEARVLLDALGIPVLGLAGDLNIDGSLGSRTALLREDYTDQAGHRGSQYLDAEAAAAHLAACTELGLQGGFHAIGDGALDVVVEALSRTSERLGESAVRRAGHRVEHAEMLSAEHIQEFIRHSVTVSAQPAFDAAWGGPDGMYARRVGERWAAMNPFATLFREGVPLAFGSDAPVTPLRPWASIRACLDHRTEGQGISARAAFIGHTRAGWRAARDVNPLNGQLVPGAPANYAVWEVEELMVQVADDRVASWSTDPRARTPLLPALDGAEPRCLQTVAAGRELYRAEGL